MKDNGQGFRWAMWKQSNSLGWLILYQEPEEATKNHPMHTTVAMTMKNMTLIVYLIIMIMWTGSIVTSCPCVYAWLNFANLSLFSPWVLGDIKSAVEIGRLTFKSAALKMSHGGCDAMGRNRSIHILSVRCRQRHSDAIMRKVTSILLDFWLAYSFMRVWDSG